MKGQILARLAGWFGKRPDGQTYCWLIISAVLLWEYIGRPWLMSVYPDLNLPSLSEELAAIPEMLGM